MLKIETPILETKEAETTSVASESNLDLKNATEKIAILEAERNKDKELLSLLLQPIITLTDLLKHGAVVDTWKGEATLNNLIFKKEYMRDSYRLNF